MESPWKMECSKIGIIIKNKKLTKMGDNEVKNKKEKNEKKRIGDIKEEIKEEIKGIEKELEKEEGKEKEEKAREKKLEKEIQTSEIEAKIEASEAEVSESKALGFVTPTLETIEKKVEGEKLEESLHATEVKKSEEEKKYIPQQTHYGKIEEAYRREFAGEGFEKRQITELREIVQPKEDFISHRTNEPEPLSIKRREVNLIETGPRTLAFEEIVKYEKEPKKSLSVPEFTPEINKPEKKIKKYKIVY